MKRRGRFSNEINGGSMADIAFLLLIFFLVSTQIVIDKGILVRLPPWNENQEPQNINQRNVFKVLVNADNQILVREEVVDTDQLKDRIKAFISNPNQSKELASKPSKAIVSLQNDRGTKYATYLEVYNEIKAAYNELRDELALSQFNVKFKNCNKQQIAFIKKTIPVVISEAEPTTYGKE